jgi:hypothetical protein
MDNARRGNKTLQGAVPPAPFHHAALADAQRTFDLFLTP